MAQSAVILASLTTGYLATVRSPVVATTVTGFCTVLNQVSSMFTILTGKYWSFLTDSFRISKKNINFSFVETH